MIIPGDIDRLLLVAPSWIGDTIMASGFFRAARAACPSAEITLAAPANLLPIVHGAPWFDRIEAIDAGGLLGPVSAGRQLGHRRPDAVVLLPGSFRSAMTAWWTRAPIRIGTRRDGRALLLTHALPDSDRRHAASTVEHYMRIARSAFGEQATDATLELVITDDDTQAATKLGIDASSPLLLLVPGANRRDKRWPAERFAAVGDALHEQVGLLPIVAGAPAEAELTRSITEAMKAPAIDGPARGLGLHGLKAVATWSRLAISNDTGPRHLAAAAGTPVVSLFGPTDHRWTTLPGCREHLLLAEPFLPESTVADRVPDQCDINRITVGDVLEAARRLLDAPDH